MEDRCDEYANPVQEHLKRKEEGRLDINGIAYDFEKVIFFSEKILNFLIFCMNFSVNQQFFSVGLSKIVKYHQRIKQFCGSPDQQPILLLWDQTGLPRLKVQLPLQVIKERVDILAYSHFECQNFSM